MSQSMVLKLVSGLLIFLGIVFIAVSVIVTIVSNQSKKKCTQKVRATILSLHKVEKLDMDHKTHYITYYPVYEYEYQGQTFQRESNVGSTKDSFTVGETREIYINPSEPDQIWENSSVIPLVRYIFFAIGVVMLIASMIIIKL